MAEQSNTIDVGEVRTNGLRLWCAKEALRQAEKRIDAELDALGKFMNRAISCIGWSTTFTAALLATAVQYHSWVLLIASVVAFLAALISVPIIWPRKWGQPGDDAGYIMSMPYQTELEMTENLATRAETTTKQNEQILSRMAKYLLISSLLLIASVLLAAPKAIMLVHTIS